MGLFFRLLIFCSFLLAFPFLPFSKKAIRAPFVVEKAEPPQPIVQKALTQNYAYLGEGKQSYAFLSADGKWILKFFKQAYFHTPLYLRFSSLFSAKKKERFYFYRQSYLLAQKELQDETALLYLHLGPTETLPVIEAKDRLHIPHKIDLNQYPFVLQKKAEAFYPLLSTSEAEERIEEFLKLVAKRIEKKIADKDHEIEANFGVCQGKLIQIDPGRLYADATLDEEKRIDQEWWSATHRLRKWLLEHEPDKIAFFDQTLNFLKKPSESDAFQDSLHEAHLE